MQLSLHYQVPLMVGFHVSYVTRSMQEQTFLNEFLDMSLEFLNMIFEVSKSVNRNGEDSDGGFWFV